MRPVANPPDPWQSTHVEYLDDPPPARLEVYEEHAKSILVKNESPDVPFAWGLNPYRGCVHACAYCYARPFHQHLGWGAGTDFDRRIVAKVNAPELLAKELRKPSWRGELVAFSGVTDCYQPIEATYGITRRCLEACAALDNPVGVVTKGSLVRRDADLLRRLRATVFLSIPFADDETARKLEPWAASITRRLDAMRALSDAGVETGVAIAPVVPGISDADVPRILERAHACGATRAFMILLRLPRETLPVFDERLREVMPERHAKVMNGLAAMRGGEIADGRFGSRMVGRDARWAMVEQLFRTTCARLGMTLAESGPEADRDAPRPRQGELFPRR